MILRVRPRNPTAPSRSKNLPSRLRLRIWCDASVIGLRLAPKLFRGIWAIIRAIRIDATQLGHAKFACGALFVAPVMVAVALETSPLCGARGPAALLMAVAAEFDPRHVDISSNFALRNVAVAGSARHHPVFFMIEL